MRGKGGGAQSSAEKCELSRFRARSRFRAAVGERKTKKTALQPAPFTRDDHSAHRQSQSVSQSERASACRARSALGQSQQYNEKNFATKLPLTTLGTGLARTLLTGTNKPQGTSCKYGCCDNDEF